MCVSVPSFDLAILSIRKPGECFQMESLGLSRRATLELSWACWGHQ